MKQSVLFPKTLKEAPKGATSISHKLLVRAGYIDQLATGFFSFLPLGHKIRKKVINIIREEMDNIGGQELSMPSMQPKGIWVETDRWDHMDPPLFKLKDRHGRDYALGPTHEEVITHLVRSGVSTYRDLPLYLYQIQTKFRNEQRATGGLLRVREFMMKDLYSFHTNEKDLSQYFKNVIEAYKKIFNRCGLSTITTSASGGAIGGTETYEFQVLCKSGEDKISLCETCGWSSNLEDDKGQKHKHKTKKKSTIEVGHVFSLSTKYSKAMKAFFVDRDGSKKLIHMGCYGIGVGRLMATIVEVSHDDKGIIWNKSIAPYDVHLLELQTSKTPKLQASNVYKKLTNAGIEVLWDDRDASAGEKFADADLIGIPVRLVISEETSDKVEWKERASDKTKLLSVDKTIRKLRS